MEVASIYVVKLRRADAVPRCTVQTQTRRLTTTCGRRGAASTPTGSRPCWSGSPATTAPAAGARRSRRSRPRWPRPSSTGCSRPVLIGEDPRRVRPLWTKLTGLMRERGHLVGHQADALAAVDIALWDLAGQGSRRCPCTPCSAARSATRCPTYVSGLAAHHRRRAGGAGPRVGRTAVSAPIKLHLGHGVEADLATFDAVRAAHPTCGSPSTRTGPTTWPTRCGWGAALDERGAWFLEAPLVPEDVAAHRELAAALVTPIAVGEAHAQPLRVPSLAAGPGRRPRASPTSARTGITEAMAIAELAAAHHLPVAPHHSVGLGVARRRRPARQRRLDSCTASSTSPTTLDVANRILTTPLVRRPGGLRPCPQTPGLGVEVDIDQPFRRTHDRSPRTRADPRPGHPVSARPASWTWPRCSRLVEFQVASGVDGVAVFGFASEGFTLTAGGTGADPAEPRGAGPGLPMVAGVGGDRHVRDAVEQCRAAADAGRERAAMVLPPLHGQAEPGPDRRLLRRRSPPTAGCR